MTTNGEWLRRGSVYFTNYRGRVARVQKQDGQHIVRIFDGDGKRLATTTRPTHSSAKVAALALIDELIQTHGTSQPSPESTPKAKTKGGRALDTMAGALQLLGAQIVRARAIYIELGTEVGRAHLRMVTERHGAGSRQAESARVFLATTTRDLGELFDLEMRDVAAAQSAKKS